MFFLRGEIGEHLFESELETEMESKASSQKIYKLMKIIEKKTKNNENLIKILNILILKMQKIIFLMVFIAVIFFGIGLFLGFDMKNRSIKKELGI